MLEVDCWGSLSDLSKNIFVKHGVGKGIGLRGRGKHGVGKNIVHRGRGF